MKKFEGNRLRLFEKRLISGGKKRKTEYEDLDGDGDWDRKITYDRKGRIRRIYIK